MECDTKLARKVMEVGNYIKKRKIDSHTWVYRYIYDNTIYLITINDGDITDIEVGEYE